MFVDGNDARRIVWVLGEFYIYFLHVFSVLIDMYRYFEVLEDTEMSVEGNDNDNWPKRRVSRRLGLR